MMDRNQKHDPDEAKDKDEGKVEHVLNKIVPPSQEVTDDKLKDPGKAITEDAPTVVNKS